MILLCSCIVSKEVKLLLKLDQDRLSPKDWNCAQGIKPPFLFRHLPSDVLSKVHMQLTSQLNLLLSQGTNQKEHIIQRCEVQEEILNLRDICQVCPRQPSTRNKICLSQHCSLLFLVLQQLISRHSEELCGENKPAFNRQIFRFEHLSNLIWLLSVTHC